MEKKIITISREFGSGGRTIGRMIAEKLGIPFYDKELWTRSPLNPAVRQSSWKNTENIPPAAVCSPMPSPLRAFRV